MRSLERLAIIGAGELGLQASHYAKLSGKYIVVGFYDDNVKEVINNLPIIGAINDLFIDNSSCRQFDKVFIALGYKHLSKRKILYDKLKKFSIPIGSILAPHVYVDSTALIGEGCFLYPGVIIDKQVVIEPNVILNIGCIISHNTHIDSHSFFAPRVTIAGFSKIGQMNFIGVGTTIVDDIETTDNVAIGAGSLVVKNIDETGLYYGHPALKR